MKRPPIKSAEEVLNNLVRVMSEYDPDEKATDDPDEAAYIERAMSIVNDWRQSLERMQRGR